MRGDTPSVQITHNNEAPSADRLAAAALAALGAASAIPIPLAQLDFAGLSNAFNIDSGDSPPALRVIAGVGGVLTIPVILLAFTGAALSLIGSRGARNILLASALAGLATAMPFWIPAALLIGAAAMVLRPPATVRRGNVPCESGVHTRTPQQGEI